MADPLPSPAPAAPAAPLAEVVDLPAGPVPAPVEIPAGAAAKPFPWLILALGVTVVALGVWFAYKKSSPVQT